MHNRKKKWKKKEISECLLIGGETENLSWTQKPPTRFVIETFQLITLAVCCDDVSNLIGRRTINIPEIISGVHGLMGFTVSGCPRTNRPLNFDQIFDFLQTFCTRQGWYRTNENTFRLLVILSIPEILRQMLLVPAALKLALSSSRN